MKIYKVINIYCDGKLGKFPSRTGHWIAAKNAEEAIRVATKYKIGNPMGRDSKHRDIQDFPFDIYRKWGGQVWMEEKRHLILRTLIMICWVLPFNKKGNGVRLIGFSTPLFRSKFPMHRLSKSIGGTKSK